MRWLPALLAVTFLATAAVYAWRARAELAWLGPVTTPGGPVPPPRVDGPWWVLRPAVSPVTGVEATRAGALAEAVRLGLGAPLSAVGSPAAPPPVPSLVRLRAGGYALLLERSREAARLFDPARGEVVLFATDPGRWIEHSAEPLGGD